MKNRIIALLLALLMVISMIPGSVFAEVENEAPESITVSHTGETTLTNGETGEGETSGETGEGESTGETGEGESSGETGEGEPTGTGEETGDGTGDSTGTGEETGDGTGSSTNTGESEKEQEQQPTTSSACDVCGDDPCTCEEAATDPDYSGDVGKYAQFIEDTYTYFVRDGKDSVEDLCFYYSDFEEGTILRITDWYLEPETQGLWYQVEFFAGGILEEFAEYWGDDPWVLQGYLDDEEAVSLEFVDISCDICGEDGCTKEHVKCEACGKYDCTTEHVKCEACGKYDCTTEHVKCEICGQYDCTIEHVFCENCGAYDCGLNHGYCELCQKEDCGIKHIKCEICGQYDCTVQHVLCEICGKYDCTVQHVKCEICGKYDCTAQHVKCDICGEYDCGLKHAYCGVCGEMDCTANHVYCSICKGFDCGIEHEEVPEEDDYTWPTEPTIPENPTLPAEYDVAIVDAAGTPVTAEDGLLLQWNEKASLSAWSAAGEEVSYQWQIWTDTDGGFWVDISDQTGKGLLFSRTMLASVLNDENKAYVRCVTESDTDTLTSDSICITLAEPDAPVEVAGETLTLFSRLRSLFSAKPASDSTQTASAAAAATSDEAAEEPKTLFARLVSFLSLLAEGDDEEEEVEYVTITIHYWDANSFRTGQEKSSVTAPYIASIPKGTADDATVVFDHTIVSPTITGFAPFWDIDHDGAGDGRIWTGKDYYDAATGEFTKPDPADAPATNYEDASEIVLELTGDEVQTSLEYDVYYLPIEVNMGVRYYFQNLNDDYYTEDVTRYYPDKMRTGTTVTEDYLTEHAGDTAGFERMYHQPATVAADGSTIFECFYDRNYYLINFSLDGGHGVNPIYSRFETPILMGSPVKSGYEFKGWDLLTNDTNGDGTPDTGDNVADELPDTVPAENRIYRALWEAVGKVNYTVAYWIVDNESDTNHADDTFIGSVIHQERAGEEVSGSDSLTSSTILCGLSEHTHTDACRGLSCSESGHVHSISDGCYQLTCAKAEHEHGGENCPCSLEEHSHETGCYTDTEINIATNQTGLKDLNSISATNGRVYRYAQSNWWTTDYYYYLRLGDTWYYLTSNTTNNPSSVSGIALTGGNWTTAGTNITYKVATADCGKAEHSHSNSCCGLDEHTHTEGDCYTLTCTKPVHTHDDSCYEYMCGTKAHTHSDCPTFDRTHLYYVSAETNVEVLGDGSTVVNVYYTYYKYTLRFYYGRRSTARGAEVVGGTSWYFGGYQNSINQNSSVQNMLEAVSQWGKVSGLAGSENDLNATGKDRVDKDVYELGQVTYGNYTYYYLQFTAAYGDSLENLWPVDIFAPVEVAETHSSHATCPDNAYFSAWNGEYKVKYSRTHQNQTIKGLYMYLDDEILYQPEWNNAYTTLSDGSRLVNYLAFWENGYNIDWSVPRLFRYQLWVAPVNGVPAATDQTYGATTGNTASPYANYVLYKGFNVYDNSNPGEQTETSLEGYTYLTRESQTLTSTAAVLPYVGNDSTIAGDMNATNSHPSYVVNFFYARNNTYSLTVNNHGTVIASAFDLDYDTPLKGLMDGFKNSSGDPLFTDSSYTPPYPSSLEAGGYYFAGWYSTPGCVPGTEVTIASAKMPAGNMAIYAKWAPVTRTVNFFYHYEYLKAYEDDPTATSITYNGETYNFTTNGGMQTRTLQHGSTLDPSEIPTPTYQFPIVNSGAEMHFVNWFYLEDGQKKAYAPSEMQTRQNLNVYAEWRDKNTDPYRISYVLKGTTTKIAEDSFGYSSAGILRTFTAKAGAPNNELYDLTSSGGKNYNHGHFPLTASHSFVVKPEADADWFDPKINVYNFEYVEATNVAYTVRHVVIRDGQELVIKEDHLTTNNAVVTVRFEELPGYTDYVADAFYKELVIAVEWDEETNQYVGAESNVVTFYYTNSSDSLYAVHHMVEKLHDPDDPNDVATNYAIDGSGGYEEYGHRIEQYAPTDTPVHITPKTIPGFKLLGGKAKVVTGGVEASGTPPFNDGEYIITATRAGTELYIFYEREKYNYTVKYYRFNTETAVTPDSTPPGSYVTDGKAHYGDEVSVTAPRYANGKSYVLVSEQTQTVQIRQDESQNEIIFYYSPIQYQIDYTIVPAGGGMLSVTKETLGSADFIGSTPTANKNYEFVGWYLDEACTVPVVDGVDGTIDSATKHFTPIRRLDINDDPITNYTFYAKFNLLAGDFTIEKRNGKAGQVFVYTLVSKDDPTLRIEVTVVAGANGYGKTVIKDLPFGEYTVTQENSWSWRYIRENMLEQEKMHDGSEEGSTAQYTGGPGISRWLAGISNFIRRIFGGT